jgi:hypothetical protein
VSRPRTLVLVSLALLLVAVAAVLGVRAWREAHRTDLQQAIALAPADAERFSFTDWAGVRRELDAGDLSSSSTYSDVEDFLGTAYDRDLSSTSAMVGSTEVLQQKFGFSPASVLWELFSQSTDGAVVTMRMPDDFAFDDLADTLTGLGYTQPADAGGVWKGGADVIARISDGIGLSPEFQFVALDAADHLVLTSDTDAYLQLALAAENGDDDTVAGLDGVVAAAGDALSAAVYDGDNVCRALAMSQADESDQARADQLVAAAGKVSPLTGFAMAAQPDGTIRVAMSFEDGDRARTNADTRARLAAGPAVGQGGDFSDRFSITRTTVDGDVVQLDLEPVPGTFVVSDLTNGPVLFATC